MEPLLWALYRTRGVTELDISHSKVDHVFFSFFIFFVSCMLSLLPFQAINCFCCTGSPLLPFFFPIFPRASHSALPFTSLHSLLSVLPSLQSPAFHSASGYLVRQVLPSGAAMLKLLGFSPSVTSLDLTSSAIRATGASAVPVKIRRTK
jgi:hypothetical protein